MIKDVRLFGDFSLLDLSLVVISVLLTGAVLRVCGRSKKKLGLSSVLLLVLGLPVSFVVYRLLGHHFAARMVELAITRICIITGMWCGASWLHGEK